MTTDGPRRNLETSLSESGTAFTPQTESNEVAELLRETLLRLQPSSEEISEAWSTAQVTMQQFRIMTILYHEGPIRVSDLALRLEVSTPTITGILDRLVKQKVSYRMSDPRDRRVVLNNLTGEGRDLVERLQPAHGKQIERAIDKLEPSERDQLSRSLRSLLRVIPH